MVPIFLRPEVTVRHYLPCAFLRMRNMSEIGVIAKFERCHSQREKATLLKKFQPRADAFDVQRFRVCAQFSIPISQHKQFDITITHCLMFFVQCKQ